MAASTASATSVSSSRPSPCYLYHLVRNHPFLDGNKRAGLMAALVFLGLNGLELEADTDRLTELVLAVAAGKMSKAETAVFIERHSRARQP